MNDVRVIEVKENILADNDKEAQILRDKLKAKKTFLMNLMSSPGSGKTTTLVRTVEQLKDKINIGIMEADVDSDVDAKTMASAGVKSIQLHTGGMCHLDAAMTEQGLNELGYDGLDLVVLEISTRATPKLKRKKAINTKMIACAAAFILFATSEVSRPAKIIPTTVPSEFLNGI